MIPDVLLQVAFTASSGAFVGGPSATERWTCYNFRFHNTNSAACTVRMHLVRPGDSEGIHNRIIPDMSIAANDIDEYTGRIIVPPSWKLTGYASTTNVVGLNIFGIRIPSP